MKYGKISDQRSVMGTPRNCEYVQEVDRISVKSSA